MAFDGFRDRNGRHSHGRPRWGVRDPYLPGDRYQEPNPRSGRPHPPIMVGRPRSAQKKLLAQNFKIFSGPQPDFIRRPVHEDARIAEGARLPTVPGKAPQRAAQRDRLLRGVRIWAFRALTARRDALSAHRRRKAGARVPHLSAAVCGGGPECDVAL